MIYDRNEWCCGMRDLRWKYVDEYKCTIARGNNNEWNASCKNIVELFSTAGTVNNIRINFIYFIGAFIAFFFLNFFP